jgi:membrane protein implicated in regulation of membrane protease activity
LPISSKIQGEIDKLSLLRLDNMQKGYFVICYNQKMTDVKEIVPVTENPTIKAEASSSSKIHVWLIVVIAVLLIGLIATGIFFLFNAPAAVTTQIRDVFIIFMALEFIVLGVAVVILIVQLAKLVNLLQNEVKPILEATSETVNTLKGTTEFLSENLVQPVIKLNGYLAGLKRVLDLVNIFRK